MLDSINVLKEFSNIPANEIEIELSDLVKGNKLKLLEDKAEIVKHRLSELVSKTSSIFVNRKEAVTTVVTSLISGIPAVLLGDPGTAKSALVRQIAEYMGLNSKNENYFEYLLTSHTMPEEIFGGMKLESLASGKIEKETRNKLPRAEIAFLDEMFRGGSHILNTLLTIINEKRFDSGAGMEYVPLLGIIGASNNPPIDPELEAFYDRFPIRLWVHSIFDSQDSIGNDASKQERINAKLLSSSLMNEKKRLLKLWSNHKDEKQTSLVSCTNDFRVARAYLISLLNDEKDTARIKQYSDLFVGLRKTLNLTDRNFGQLWLFAAAYDFINEKALEPYPNADGHVKVFEYAISRANKVDRFQNEFKHLKNDILHIDN